MRSDFGIVTVACGPCVHEFALMCVSASYFLGDEVIPMVVLTDDRNATSGTGVEFIHKDEPFDLRRVGYDKTRVIREGLKRWPSVLYCDTDVLFVGEWDCRLAPGVTLSEHRINANAERNNGRFNSGYIGVTREGGGEFCDWWDQAPKECPGYYGDQKCLEEYRQSWLFQTRHNVGWWQHKEPQTRPINVHAECGDLVRYDRFEADVCYPPTIVSLHTHLLPCTQHLGNVQHAREFNAQVLSALEQSTDKRHNELLRMIRGA